MDVEVSYVGKFDRGTICDRVRTDSRARRRLEHFLIFNCLAEEGCSELEEGVAGGAEGGESRVVGVREDLGEKFGWETGHEVEKSRS
jgi:hypothetical protein